MSKYLTAALVLLFFIGASAQEPDFPALEYRTVIPGEEYQAGALFRVFFGDHWRSLWTTPIRVPVADLQKFAGGLSVLKTGGGFQTKSLHFKGADGKFYKFRSVNKDPSKLLPEDLQNSFAADILQDQISTSHPMSAVIVAPMLSAVGVLNTQPVICILPDSPLLGEYRDLYKNLLGTLAENPKDDTEEDRIFAGAEKIKNDYDIFEELDEDNADKVDGAAYLKVRLMDILLGDWDRHVGQWKWARYDKGDQKVWYPIPRDRDQAFSRYDGFFPWIASKAVTQIENFDEDYPQINDLTWSGRHLDRRFLMEVDKAAWDSVTAFVLSAVTDQVIEAAVAKMPPAWYEKEGDFLVRALKKRRDNLQWASIQYYEEISKYISIKTSDKDEQAEISRVADDQVLVEIYDLDKNGRKKKKPFYRRKFTDQYTSDIRIFLQGGDDKAVVRGNVNESINVRVIGGAGADTLIDSSNVDGCLFYVLPVSDAENKTEFYDSDAGTHFIPAGGTTIDTEKAPEPKPFSEGDNVHEKYEPPVRDWGYDWKPGQWLGFSSYDGLQIGGGPILIRHSFRADPYVWKMSAMYGYAFGPQSNRFELKGAFYGLIRDWRVDITVGKNELAYNRFYGLGNETRIDDDLDEDYYRVSNELINADMYFVKQISEYTSIDFSAVFKNSDLKNRRNSVIASDNFRGLGSNNYLTFGLEMIYDQRDSRSNTKNGLTVRAAARYMPEVLDNDKAYSKGIFDSRFYYTPEFLAVTLANRIYGEKVWGDYFLYDAAILGGSDLLRGFTRERFSGDAALMFASELRMPLFKLRLVIPGMFGISGHAETGRVFYDKVRSDLWHASAGGSLWVSYLHDAIMLNMTGSQSSEGLELYISTGFMF